MPSQVLQLVPTTLCNSQQDVVDRVRDLADEIAAGDFDQIKTIIAVIETKDGRLTHHTIGDPCDLARAVGLLTMEMIRSSTETE